MKDFPVYIFAILLFYVLLMFTAPAIYEFLNPIFYSKTRNVFARIHVVKKFYKYKKEGNIKAENYRRQSSDVYHNKHITFYEIKLLAFNGHTNAVHDLLRSPALTSKMIEQIYETYADDSYFCYVIANHSKTPEHIKIIEALRGNYSTIPEKPGNNPNNNLIIG